MVAEPRAAQDPRAKVEADLEHVTRSIQAECRPLAVYLLGSFGRGEGVVAEGRYVSDMEIAVVGRTPPRGLARLSRKLSADLHADVKLYYSPLLRFRLAESKIPRYRFDRPLLSTFDFRHGSRLLAGEDLLGRLPPCDPATIPPAEGLRLLGNRAAEFLERGEPAIAKLVCAAGDAILTARKSYVLLLRDRAEKLSFDVDSRLYKAAANARLAGSAFTIDPALLRRALAESATEVAGALGAGSVEGLLSTAACKGAHHTGFMTSPKAWDAYCRLRLASKGVRVQSSDGALVEWVVCVGLLRRALADDGRDDWLLRAWHILNP